MNYKIIVYKNNKLYAIDETAHTAQDALALFNKLVKLINNQCNYYTMGFKFTIMIYLNNKRIKTLVIDRR